MATFFPGGLFSVSSLTSASMNLRNERLKLAKSHADKNQRELSRDRLTLERKEKQLLTECKRLATRGDLNGARMVANQIASYRRIHDRNLQASIMIGTKAQSMVSDHKVNKGQVETIKGFSYANTFENFGRLEAREQRYSYRMSAINHMESSMRESMDDAYRSNDDEATARIAGTGGDETAVSQEVARMQDMEVQMILNQALGQQKGRIYMQTHSDSSSDDNAISPPFIVHLKSFERPEFGASITLNPVVSTRPNVTNPLFSVNTATVDTVKRCIIDDPYASGQLNLHSQGGSFIRPFELGRFFADTMEFEQLDFSVSLRDLGIASGDFLYVRLLDLPPLASGGGGGAAITQIDDEELKFRERMDRINGRY